MACLDPGSSDDLRQMHLHLAHRHDSVALSAMLAVSAAHMVSLGLMPETVLVAAQQNSLKAMIAVLNSLTLTSNNTRQITSDADNGTHVPSPALADDSIVASLLLLGPEIIHGEADNDRAKSHYLLLGAQSLIVERHKYFECQCALQHPARSWPEFQLDSPLYQSTLRSLAFTDIMACVPCAKRPLVGKEYWLDRAVHATHEGIRDLRPDPDLGYCARILSLLGDCATTVDGFFRGLIPDKSFFECQTKLLEQMEDFTRDLPEILELQTDASYHSPLGTEGKGKAVITAHNNAVFAAISHALASQIFLLRATDHVYDSPVLKTLCSRLAQSIARISVDDNSVATIMLWPLWVLGCESSADGCGEEASSRTHVKAILQTIYEQQRIKSVANCLRRLERDIWTVRSGQSTDLTEHASAAQQATWVRRCWDDKIEVILA